MHLHGFLVSKYGKKGEGIVLKFLNTLLHRTQENNIKGKKRLMGKKRNFAKKNGLTVQIFCLL